MEKLEWDIDWWSFAHFFGSAFLVFLLAPHSGAGNAATITISLGWFWEVIDPFKPHGVTLFHRPETPQWIQDTLDWLANGFFASNGKFGLGDLCFDAAGCFAAYYLLTLG